MNKTAYIIMMVGLAIGIGILFTSGSKIKNNQISTENQILNNIEIKDGIQYVTINAKGGYLPRISEAKADVPTKLIVKTSGTYDCSASLVIRSIGYQKILPNTGETIIDLGTPKVDKPLVGVCGMGMYSFQVNFKS
jgi:plastocyanin domain-containing protein